MEVSEIGSAIRAARVAAGMTQVGVAERVGVSKTLVSRYESGIRFPKATVLCALAEVLPILHLEEMLEAEHRHWAEVCQKRSRAAVKQHARKRAAKEAAPKLQRPRKRVHSLTPAQKQAAVNWAAEQAGMNYGEFVAWIRLDEYPEIYERYWAYLNGGVEV